jgi:amino acid adenylation domain-containing protein/FkbM family methyltransferase
MTTAVIEGLRLSPQQKRLWTLQRLDGPLTYRAQCLVRITGSLDVARLVTAIERVAQQQEILRTTFRSFPGMNIPLQVIEEESQPLINVHDLQDRNEDKQEEQIAKLFYETQQTCFDLECCPLLHTSLIRLSADTNVLILLLPSLNSDSIGLKNLVKEISLHYGAVLNDEYLAGELMQYADSSEWHNELLEAPEREEGRAYWREQDFSTVQSLELPFRSQRAKDTKFVPQYIVAKIEAKLTAEIEKWTEQHNVSLSVFLLACWQVLLWRLTAKEQIIVGGGNNSREHEELKTALGLFHTYLPLQCRLFKSLRISELLDQLVRTTDESAEYQRYFSWEQSDTTAETDATTPFFHFCFDYAEQPANCVAGGLTFTIEREYVCAERFHVRLSCVRGPAGLTLEFHYDSGLYRKADIWRLAEEFQTLIGSITANNDRVTLAELEIVGEAERQKLLAEWNDTAAPYAEDECIHQLFERQVAQTPNSVAVIYQEQELTYTELDQRANQLAHYLRSRGVGPEVRVGLCVERSLEMIVGLLGILKAGGAYVPLDPTYPRERLGFMLADTAAPILLTQQRLIDNLPSPQAQVVCLDTQWKEIARESSGSCASDVLARNLAYVIYTSGSTGTPKGVLVTHHNLVHSTVARSAYYHTPPSRFLLLSAFSFDSSVAGIFWTLCGGGALVLPGKGMQRDGLALVRLIEREGVTHLLSLPSLHGVLLETAEARELENLQVVIVAGEVCAPELVRRHRRALPQARLYNEYGPTEVTVWSSVYQCAGPEKEEGEEEEGRVVAIGRPIINAQVYILDEQLRPVAIGEAGELYLGGPGISRGYLHRGDVTAERYLPHPFSAEGGARLYKTGDVGRYRGDGNLEFLGRRDAQVKLRGYRIELGEIEAALAEHEAVREAVVVARAESGRTERLVGYLELEPQRAAVACRLLRGEGTGANASRAYELPNGMMIMAHNRNEAEYLYQEIFAQQAYLGEGIRLPRSACVFDVGANIGLFSLFVAQVCQEARIYAFEPMPEIFQLLRANAELYGLEGRLFECGLAEADGQGSFSYYPNLSLISGRFPNAAEAHAVVGSFEENSRVNGGGMPFVGKAALSELLTERLQSRPIECRLRTISEVMKSEGVKRIDLLKIDVEKSELAVLQGIEAEDWAKIRQVVVELEDRGGRLAQVMELLVGAGYELAVEQAEGLQKTELYKVFALRGGAGAVEGIGKDETSARLRGPLPDGWRSPEQVREAVRRLAGQRLPEYMMPETLVLLPELPRLANGKVDRQALPAPEQVMAKGEHSPPRTPVEEVLAGIWSTVLGAAELSVTANFFELGGHSLLATQVMSRVKKAFNIELPVRSLFGAPTIRGLAAQVELAIQTEQGAKPPPLEKIARTSPLPVSFAQQRLWFLHQLEPGSAFYHCPAALRLRGPLNVAVLEQTLTEIIRRHEVLRTSFPEQQGKPIQVIAPATKFALVITDLSGENVTERESVARRFAAAEAERPFDLSTGPLLRARLLKLDDEEYIALFTTHHIVCDEWSMGVLIKEVSLLYEAYSRREESPLAELEVQYADYAMWQREWLQGEVLAGQLNYWRKQLGGTLELLRLPTDKVRPAIQTFVGASQSLTFSAEVLEVLRALSLREGTTLFMTLLAAWQTLLYCYSGQEEIVVGTPIANRNRPETEDLIGFFVNTLVLRGDLSGNPSFRELLQRVREQCLEGYAHQDLPFEKLVEELRPERSLSHSPLFQVWFALQSAVAPAALRMGDLRFEEFKIENLTSKSDLVLSVKDMDQSVEATLDYSSDLFRADTISRMLQSYELLVSNAASQPNVRLAELKETFTEADKRQRHEKDKVLDLVDRQSLQHSKRKAVSAHTIAK